MNSELQKSRNKGLGIKKQINNFKYCFTGIGYALKNEQSMISHFIIAIITVGMGFFFKISKMEWICVVFCIGLVVSLELINTAVEAACDVAMPDLHPLVKIAKDSSAAAVLIGAITALIIGILIFLPKILQLF